MFGKKDLGRVLRANLQEAILAGNLDTIRAITRTNFFTTLNSGNFLRFATANPQVAPEVIETLLEEGCQINSSDQNGMTALMFACTNNNQPAAQVLLDRGADVTYQNNRGRTALMMCFYPELPNPALIRTMLTQANGANILVLPSTEEAGTSAFERACILALQHPTYTDIVNEMAASAARDGQGTQPVRMMYSYRQNFGEILSIQGVQDLLSTETLGIVHDSH